MDQLDLKALANSPGYGGTERALKQAGRWDEFAGAGPVREFMVYLRADIVRSAYASTVLQARSEAEARHLAGELARKNLLDWETSEPEGWEVETVLDSQGASSEPDSLGRSDGQASRQDDLR